MTPSQQVGLWGRMLAHGVWDAAAHALARVPKPYVPSREALAEAEKRLGRAMSASESTIYIHAYRSELHALNAERELKILNQTRGRL